MIARSKHVDAADNRVDFYRHDTITFGNSQAGAVRVGVFFEELALEDRHALTQGRPWPPAINVF